MEARHVPGIYDSDSEPWEVADAYRVTLWEQPAPEPETDGPRSGYGIPPGVTQTGWEAMEFELVGAQADRQIV